MGDWDFTLRYSGWQGYQTPEQLGYDLRLEFGTLPDNENKIFYQSFKNDTLINYAEVSFQYEQSWFGEGWHFDSLFIYTDDYYQYIGDQSLVTFYSYDSITIEEACSDCMKFFYERKKCEIFDTIQVYDTIVYNVYDTTYISIYDSIFIFDTTNIIIYDTIPIIDTLIVFDTVIFNIYDTTFLTIYDTVIVYDTIIIYDTITSISNNKSVNIKISPNPATDKVFIQSPIIMNNIMVFTINGKLIRQEEPYDYETILDLDIREKGMYIVHIKTAVGETIKKLVIK